MFCKSFDKLFESKNFLAQVKLFRPLSRKFGNNAQKQPWNSSILPFCGVPFWSYYKIQYHTTTFTCFSPGGTILDPLKGVDDIGSIWVSYKEKVINLLRNETKFTLDNTTSGKTEYMLLRKVTRSIDWLPYPKQIKLLE